MISNPKADIYAPCGVATGKIGDSRYPAIECSYNCKTCGWNPAERKRREETGVWKPLEKRLNIETGEEIQLNGVKQLVFSRRDDSESV